MQCNMKLIDVIKISINEIGDEKTNDILENLLDKEIYNKLYLELAKKILLK